MPLIDVTQTSRRVTETTGIASLKLVIFDMDQVLCRYDRPLRLRLRRLAALCGRDRSRSR